jgi:Uncharacterized protein conserved in bacteria
MINGLDETSLKCFDALATGHGPTDLVSYFDISIDQAKRLSRLYKLHKLAKQHLTPKLFMKLKSFGQKALMWSRLFKTQDWEGLAELITATDPDTHRDTYTHMVSALKEKRQRVVNITENYQDLLDRLERKEQDIERVKAQQEDYQTQIRALINEIDNFPEAVQNVLIDAVGRLNEEEIYLNPQWSPSWVGGHKPQYVLTRRLVEDWQNKMKRDKILYYDDLDYIWHILDINAFAAQIQKRLSNGRKRIFYEGPKSTHYRFHDSKVSTKLRKDMETLELKLKELEAEKKKLKRQLNQSKKRDPKSFLENVLVSNQLSAKDIETHGRLQAQGLKWLFNQNFVAVAELVHGNHRFDVIGYSRDDQITIIEVKASIEDFRRDTKWLEYLQFCDRLYFLIKDELSYYSDFTDLVSKGAGLLTLSQGSRIKEVYGAPTLTTKSILLEIRRELEFEISRLASRWATYGFTPNKLS